ncbi:MAG: hypothetical protein IPK07_25940 [Deltaproteobacteria bacterium]|nr:hypothetical protein [Deltaproteobacteria bacterium]
MNAHGLASSLTHHAARMTDPGPAPFRDRRTGPTPVRRSRASAVASAIVAILAYCTWVDDARSDDSIAPAAAEATAPPAFAVSKNAGSDSWVATDFTLEIGVTPWPVPEQGTVGVRFGETDVTGLFTPVGDRLRYDGSAVPLPAGETEIVVALVGPMGRGPSSPTCRCGCSSRSQVWRGRAPTSGPRSRSVSSRRWHPTRPPRPNRAPACATPSPTGRCAPTAPVSCAATTSRPAAS